MSVIIYLSFSGLVILVTTVVTNFTQASHNILYHSIDGLRPERRPRHTSERSLNPQSPCKAPLTRNSSRRALHAPLTWDSKLTKDAQQCADQLASIDSGTQHSKQLSQQRQGENLASCPGPWPNPYRESSKLWYAEKKNWKGGVFQAQDTQAVGHDTQVRCRRGE